jgi:SAM-dependent methyltransferase
MSEYVELLQSMMPNFFWFRDGHSVSGNRANIWGTILLRDGIHRDDVTAFVDGQQVEWSGQKRSAYADDKFWFVDDSRKFQIEFGAELDEKAPSFTATACLCSTESARLAEFTFNQYIDWQGIEPTPPIANIERVSGKGATGYNYHNNGSSDFLRFCSIAERHGAQIISATKILDWGCGCGRLTRHLQEKGMDAVGIDIDPFNISWCQQNLDAEAFQTTDLFPPTSFPAGSFDLVIANSVLSHLTLDAMEAWLDEIYRLLRPGGLALLSYHGQFSLCGFSSKTESFVRGVLESGFNANLKANEVNDVIPDPEYYRHTFMTDEYATRLFKRKFSVEEQVVGVVSRFQNLAVLRKTQAA